MDTVETATTTFETTTTTVETVETVETEKPKLSELCKICKIEIHDYKSCPKYDKEFLNGLRINGFINTADSHKLVPSVRFAGRSALIRDVLENGIREIKPDPIKITEYEQKQSSDNNIFSRVLAYIPLIG